MVKNIVMNKWGKTYRTVTIIWWIGARLVYGLELLRLAIFCRLPRPKIQRLAKLACRWDRVNWVYQYNRLYCIKFNEVEEKVEIYKLPLLRLN